MGSRLAGVSEPLVAGRITVAFGSRYAILTQVQPSTSFPKLRSSFERLSAALALAELYAALIPAEQPDPDLFDLLVHSLSALERHDRPLVALVWAELRLMAEAGFQPEFDPTGQPGERVGVAPSHGGLITHGERTFDRFEARREVLIGLARCAELVDPPPNLRNAEECLKVLLPFWRHIAEAPLPANESLATSFNVG